MGAFKTTCLLRLIPLVSLLALQPIVLTVPQPDKKNRYMSVQVTHLKGYETDYVGTRMR